MSKVVLPKIKKVASIKAPIRLKNKRNDYVYTSLKDCNIAHDHDDKYNFYAAALDAAFPHKSFKSERYICSIKIADPDQAFDKEGVVEYCTLMLFAKKFEDLPICQRVGDIIRVHRATM